MLYICFEDEFLYVAFNNAAKTDLNYEKDSNNLITFYVPSTHAAVILAKYIVLSRAMTRTSRRDCGTLQHNW